MALTLEDIIAHAKTCFAAARGSHAWDHTERVYGLCMHIGRVEEADLEVLAIAAYLHDVGRPLEDESKGTICHAEKGAEIAETLLVTYPLSIEKKETSSTALDPTGFAETTLLKRWRPEPCLTRTNSIPSVRSVSAGLFCLPGR